MGFAPKLPSGRPFETGHHKVGGRKPGTPNRFNRDVKEFFRSLVDDPEVQASIRDQIVSGKKGSAQLFLGAAAHVLGRPTESVQLDTTPNMSRLLMMAARERELREQKRAAPPKPSTD